MDKCGNKKCDWWDGLVDSNCSNSLVEAATLCPDYTPFEECAGNLECTCSVCRKVKSGIEQRTTPGVAVGSPTSEEAGVVTPNLTCYNSECRGYDPKFSGNCRDWGGKQFKMRLCVNLQTTPVESKVEKSEEKVQLADMMRDFNLAFQEVARVTDFGCTKHGELGGWRNVPGFRRVYQNAKARHAIEGLINLGATDSESGLLHLAHEAWNALALLQTALEDGAKAKE